MKWIVVAIILFIGGYTYLTLHYRKPGRSYEPYADMKNRANTGRLLAAGYQRIELPIQRPTDETMKSNTAMPAPGGLPEGLKATLVSAPLLPSDIADVHAADSIASSDAYLIQFRCLSADDRQQLGDVEFYIHGDEIIITPNLDRLGNGLQSRTRDTLARVTIPANTLKPGTYRVTMTGSNTSRSWRLVVR